MWKPSYAIYVLLLVAASFLAGSWYSRRNADKNLAPRGRQILYYVDPMHPGYKSAKPGIAPDCGMQLEPVYADRGTSGAEGAAPPSLPAGTVHINPDRQQIIGVQFGLAEKTFGTHLLRTSGRVAVDETRFYRIITGTDGWIQEIFPSSIGSLVKKNQPLVSFYSRDFLTAQQAYFYALKTLDRLKKSPSESAEQLALTGDQVRSAEENLKALGMSDHQIEEIARTRQSARSIVVTSPVTGFVLARNVFLGQRFERGTELFRLVDSSRVWILADVYEDESEYIRPGSVARVSLRNHKRIFRARVGDDLPQFDPNSRTLKMRLELDNPGYTLRPDMFVDVELPVRLPPAITVPADAVLDSGLRKTVFVDRGNGYFEPRRVETGSRYGDRVEIVKGLDPGERIVVSGNFLIDSESRMKLAAAGLYGDLNKDPVCGMDVAEGKAKAAGRTSEYRGKTYFFCSDHCREQFRNDPESYLKPQTGNSSPPS